ncbi:tripartite tricarboxylate transporter substrate-binding protein [Bradyrhizobium sp.]
MYRYLSIGSAAAATRPIMMIVPFAPGGASDFVARTIQAGISEILGQQIVVDNRPGAAGIIGTVASTSVYPSGVLQRWPYICASSFA